MRRFLSLLTVLMLCGVFAFAQNRVVSGKVTNSDGTPVSFATVKLRGTPTGVSADVNGAYSIKVKDGDVLEISGAGFESQRITVRSNTNVVDVQMRATAILSEVVVTALGIKRQSRELGYSTTKVNSEELNAGKVTNAATGLQGKVSGLQVNLNNNGVKPNVHVTLRGNRSITNNNEALLVVDDVLLPMSYFGSLNPNDIESTNVLKGGAASALYGSNASNGVIIVTTKKGVKGKPVIRIGSTASFETIGYTPEFQNEFGPWGGEPASFPGMVTFPDQPNYIYAPYENQNYGPRYNGRKVPIGAPIRIFRNDGTYFISQDSTLYAAKANAKRDFFDKGLTFQNDVSYSGGDDKSKFFFSFQDVNAKGVMPKDVSRRNSIRANGSREGGIFKVDYNIGYTLTHTNTTPGTNVPFSSTTGQGSTVQYVGGGSYFQNRPVYYTVISQPSMVDLRDYRNWQNNPYASPDGFFNAYYGNPWWQIDQSRLDERNSDLIANFAITIKPKEWLNFVYKAGIVRNDYSNKYTKAGYNFAAWAIADTLASGNIPSGVKVLSPSQGDALSWSQRLTSDFLATIHKTHKDFDINFIAGTAMFDVRQRSIYTNASVLVIPDFYNISNRVGEPGVAENFSERRDVSAFGDLTVGYKNYAFLHGSLRNDWTSVLAPANRSFLYPGADLSLIFTDAIKSLKNNYYLSYGKIRAAWSKTGNVGVGSYKLANVFGTGGGFPFGGVAGFTVGDQYANPNLKPEFITDKEVGLELGFFKNRVLLNAAYYMSSSVNQTLPIAISPTTGFTSTIINTGEMTNKGIELDLKVSPIVKTRSGFRWDISANYSYNRNKVVSLIGNSPEQFIGGSSYAIVGQAYPSIKVSDWLRDSATGRIIVDKVTGMPSLDSKQKFMGTATAPTKVGLSTSITYKGFTFSATAEGRFGAVIYNAIGSDLDFTGVSKYSTQSGRQPLVIPNSVYFDGAKYVPNTNINTQDGNLFWAQTWNTANSNYVNSADFWKLRELSFGYAIPKKLLNGYIKAVNMQITARNLFTKKAKENVWSDPEFSNTSPTGFGNATGTAGINELPPTKFVQFSLNLTF